MSFLRNVGIHKQNDYKLREQILDECIYSTAYSTIDNYHTYLGLNNLNKNENYKNIDNNAELHQSTIKNIYK